LAEDILQSAITPTLSHALYLKTQGVPFFVEELIATMQENHHLKVTDNRVDLLSDENIPLPETVRDAILIRFDKLSPPTKAYLEIASVVGQQFSFELVANFIEHESFDEAIQNGFLIKSSVGEGQFRHALTREAIYNEISWTKVRDLHRKIAGQLEVANASPNLVAEHWHAGKELQNARRAYMHAVDISCSIHAYADAAHAATRAIDLWPEGEDEMDRHGLLKQLGHCAQISGSLTDAARAWREAAEGYAILGASQEYAEVQGKLATVYGLQGTWGKAMSAHQLAADAFLDVGSKQEATNELLSLAAHLHSSGKYEEALPIAEEGLTLAQESKDTTQEARLLGLLGSLKTRMGFADEGVSMAQAGLSLALAEDSFSAASELYQRLGAIMEHLSDYPDAENTYAQGVDFCEMHGLAAYAHLCQACVTVVLFQTGKFEDVIATNKAVIAADDAPHTVKVIAKCLLGLTYSYTGEDKQARTNLEAALYASEKLELTNGVMFCHWGLAVLDWKTNNLESAKNHAQSLLTDALHSEESHYSIPALRFMATLFSSIDDGSRARASADALSRIATTLSNYESLAGLSHALGEVAWVNDQLPQALGHFEKAIELIADKDLPLAEAETKYRAGLASLVNDQKEEGVALLASAYQLTEAMGERFYGQRILAVLNEHGFSIEKLLGKRKAANR
jgi:tetratricopeptide (TPR) repeat protein